MIHPYRSVVPSVHPSVWVADSAHVIGDVELAGDASVWFGSMVRGHAARLHGCAVASHCLIGIGAIVLDGAEIGEESIIAAGALVAPGTKIPPRSMVNDYLAAVPKG